MSNTSALKIILESIPLPCVHERADQKLQMDGFAIPGNAGGGRVER